MIPQLPRNTLMELAAMTLPRELSAVVSMTAAFLMAKSQYSTVQYSIVQYKAGQYYTFLVANTSIMEVPRVRTVMAVTSSRSPIRQPNILAKSL